jgi:4-hydroxy-tetrahydrodipicolinate synthase
MKEIGMNSAEIRERLKGVVVTNVTPFTENGSVDVAATEKHATFLVDNGIKIVVPGGNTGEFTSLSTAESKEVTSAVARAVGDRALVLAGVGWSAPNAVEQAEHAQSVGAQAVMVHHPVHTYIHREGLRRYYERIIESTDIGIVLYKRGPELTDALIAELVQHERVVGVKYAMNDVNAFTNLVDGSTAEVTWLCGTAERWAPYFQLGGAVGFTSGLANFAPKEALALFDALNADNWAEAMRIRRRLTGFEELRQGYHSGNNVPAVKEAMRLLGLDTGVLRDPLVPLTSADQEVVRRTLVEWGYEV